MGDLLTETRSYHMTVALAKSKQNILKVTRLNIVTVIPTMLEQKIFSFMSLRCLHSRGAE